MATAIGLVGTGFVARGAFAFLAEQGDLVVTKVLSRRPEADLNGQFGDKITNSVDELIEHSEIVLEASGDTFHAAEVLTRAGRAGRKLVTMNSEAQVTIGSALLRAGYFVTEAHGDQPGSLAELAQEAVEFGFEPLAYVNLKGFLNTNPSRAEMEYWGPKQGLSVRSVTAFTDGSKLQIEQAFIANGLRARIARQGMIGGQVDDLADLDHLAEAALELGEPISDYVVHPGGPPGILVLAQNSFADQCTDYLPFTRLKTRKGLAYRLLRPHHLVFLEIVKTLRQVAAGGSPLLNNSLAPRATAATVIKRALPADYVISQGLGGFDVRGEAVELASAAGAIPITLCDGVRLRHSVEPGQLLTWSDAEVPESLALKMYQSVVTGAA